MYVYFNTDLQISKYDTYLPSVFLLSLKLHLAVIRN
jgi:hypothetical protein